MTRRNKKKSGRPQPVEQPAVGVTPAPPETTRRDFLRTLWLVIGGVALIEFVAVAVNFLWPRRPRSGAGDAGIIVAGPIERFEPGTVTAFPRGKFYLARLGSGGFLALARECTHLGCTVPWDSENKRFVCPCHASSFDITGRVLSPPAPRPLDLYAVRIENAIVKVDTSRKIKRQSFHPGQVTFS